VKIFISYRRADSQLGAAELHRQLALIGGASAEIFLDLASINPGEPYPERIATRVAECDILLAVIGPDWLDAKGSDGVRRLENDNDYVRLEIASALQRGTRVVPVFLERPPLDEKADLPRDLAGILTLNGASIAQPTFGLDVEKLARKIGLPQGGEATTAGLPQHSASLSSGKFAYVSYSDGVELPRLRSVVRQLLAEKIPVWVHNPVALGFRPTELSTMMSERSGQSWKEGGLVALKLARCVVALVDRHTVNSDRQSEEIVAAIKRDVMTCAALEDDYTSLPESILKRNPQRIMDYDVIDPKMSKALLMLVSDVKGLLEGANAPKARWSVFGFKPR
jgi:hypothetical protein